MASEMTLYTRDRTWKAELHAFKNSLFVYKSIGTEVTVYHLEHTHRFLFFGNKIDWVKKPADAISISNHYTGLLPSLTPSAADRGAEAKNVDSLEEKLYAAGIGITLYGPPIEGGSVGGNASLEVRTVTGQITVRIGNEVLRGTVDAR